MGRGDGPVPGATRSPSAAAAALPCAVALAALVALAGGCGEGGGASPWPADSGTGPYAGLLTTARTEGSVLVIVDLAIPFTPEANLSPEAVGRQRQAIARAQDDLLRALSGHSVTTSARYDRLPQIALRVDEPALRILIASPLVRRIQANVPVAPAGT
jgi:hypothetical protein